MIFGKSLCYNGGMMRVGVKNGGKCGGIVLGGLVMLGLTLSVSGLAYADDEPEVDIVNVTVPVSCTLDGVGMNSHTTEINNHDYETEIGTTTLTAYCNDANGFSIYAIGYSDEEYGNTDLIGQATNELIPTGTTLDGTVSNWAMKLATESNATYPITLMNGYGSYHSVPASYTLVAERQAATDVGTAAIGSVLTTTYAASVSPTQIADTYVGKVRYTLVHPYTELPLQPQVTDSGKICYYPNGSNVEGTMGCQTISASATSATLLASNFSRDGYGFAGWSDKFDYSTGANFYGPQEDITFTAGEYTGNNDGLSLYAYWVESAGDLQNWSGCSSLASGAVTALTDQRDNDTYAVAKLADGNCWMIENLRLESTNSDNSTGALAQGYGNSSTYGNFSGLATAEDANFTDSTTANSLYYSGTQSGDATVDIGTTNYPGYRMPRYNNLNTPANANNRPQNPTSNTFTNNNTTVGMYSYGNYYTWHAAIADLTYNGTNNSSSDTTSLCPTGWRLPRGGQNTVTAGQNGDFYVLTTTLTGMVPNNANSGYAYYSGTVDGTNVGKLASDSLRNYPNNFLYSGYFYTSSARGRGSYGGYWSSTAYSNYNSYRLYLDSSNVSPGTSRDYKYCGFSIRCTVSAGT